MTTKFPQEFSLQIYKEAFSEMVNDHSEFLLECYKEIQNEAIVSFINSSFRQFISNSEDPKYDKVTAQDILFLRHCRDKKDLPAFLMNKSYFKIRDAIMEIYLDFIFMMCYSIIMDNLETIHGIYDEEEFALDIAEKVVYDIQNLIWIDVIPSEENLLMRKN